MLKNEGTVKKTVRYNITFRLSN